MAVPVDIWLRIALAIVAFWLSIRRRNPIVRAWREIAEEAGLTDINTSSGLAACLEARSAELRVRFEGSEYDLTRVIVGVPGRVELTLRGEGKASMLERFMAREIQIGDESFDNTFYVQGPPALTRGVLDARTRYLLETLRAQTEVEVWSGEVRALVSEAAQGGLFAVAPLTRLLPMLLEVARRLRQPADLVQRLAHNATRDPETEVRLQNLLILIREYPQRPAAVAAFRAACSDENAEIRLRAATALGEEGFPTLLAVAGGEDVDDDCAARAVAELGLHLTREQATAILDRSLRRRRVQTASACIAALGWSGDASVVGLLAKVMVVEQGDLATAAARALGDTGLPAAEAPLVQALGRDDADLRLAAAEALGAAGSAAAVLPLKEAEARHGDDAAFRRAARQAIAEIQSRLEGAAPGQLSLATEAAGLLSLVEDERGRLSIPDPGDR